MTVESFQHLVNPDSGHLILCGNSDFQNKHKMVQVTPFHHFKSQKISSLKNTPNASTALDDYFIFESGSVIYVYKDGDLSHSFSTVGETCARLNVFPNLNPVSYTHLTLPTNREV